MYPKLLVYACLVLVSTIGLRAEDSLSGKVDLEPASSTPEDTDYLQPISLDFKGATLREVVRVLSAETHINFVIPDRLTNTKVYISLKNVPWDKALKAILETNNLGIVKMSGDVVRIDSLDNLDKEKQDSTGIRQRAALVTPTKVLVVRLSYAKAATIKGMLTNLLPSASFDKRVKVDTDDRTNSLIVEAIPQELSKIRSIIERIDLQTPQVRIESRVIEILKKHDNNLGINWGTPFNYDQGRGLGFGNLVFPNHILSKFAVDTGATSTGNQSGAFDIQVGSINNIATLNLKLRMGELVNETHSLQNNNILVLDGEQANIEAGTEDFFQIPTGNGQTALSSVSYLLTLKVTPRITADGSVQMNITVENSSPRAPTSSQMAASKSTRTLTTNMLRKTGETAVIGGLYTTSIVESKQGWPFLMDIPIVGLLFRTSSSTEDRRELIILVTPTIVSGTDRIAFMQKEKDEATKKASQTEDSVDPLDDGVPIDTSVNSTESIDPLEEVQEVDSREAKILDQEKVKNEKSM